MEVQKIQGEILSANALKIIAALAMVADHVGLMFFPQVRLLRIIGRTPAFSFGSRLAIPTR